MDKFLGNRLTYARNRLGVSMQDVAEWLDVGRQYVHKIETGKENKAFSDEQLAVVASRLGVEVSYFFRPQVISISNDRLHFRSIAIPNYIRDRAKIYAEDFISVCSYIKDFIEPLGLEFPHFSLDEQCDIDVITANRLHKREIEGVAEFVRDKLNIGGGPISNMVRLLETNGVVICTASEISTKVDAFCNNDVFPIVVRNDSKSAVRCRFDLAHELGHLVMHKGMSNDIIENPMIEKQANHFASCLLLPKEAFINEFPKFNKTRIPWDSLLKMKLRWKVSIAALIMRAHDLGLITDASRKKAFIHISHKGWRTSEPADSLRHPDYIETEQPEIIANAVRLLMNTHSDFLPNMSSSLGLSGKMIRDIIGMPELDVSNFERSENRLRLVT